ncbi:NYN domain-containing protein [Oryzibacter oryziterrae]|uniref:NYN domain-containing protein n=1 Tax=Oryzibacter oryziterrae TaxID=2766474 RepID=UPI001F2C84EE|nr:NYN domain-containing protein [Oryzibacter oryziterrae]
MSLKDTIRVVQSGRRRIKLFVDFWNVMINARKLCKNFDIDVRWDALSELLVSSTRLGHFDDTIGELAGCYVFGSVSNSNPKEKEFVDRVLDQYGAISGLFFNFAPRVPKQSSTTCPQCSNKFKTFSESGVDVLLSVEMIKHATMREHEYLGLISSDRDFIPLLSYLKDQGQRVIHVSTGRPDRDMRSVTWSQIDLSDFYPSICRIRHDGCIVLTSPCVKDRLDELLSASSVDSRSLRILDITNSSEICDKDLDFILKNKNIYWKMVDDEDGRTRYSHSSLSDSIDGFRKLLADGDIEGNLPYVLREGETELYYSGESSFRWIQMAGQDADRRWPKLFRPSLD